MAPTACIAPPANLFRANPSPCTGVAASGGVLSSLEIEDGDSQHSTGRVTAEILVDAPCQTVTRREEALGWAVATCI